MTNEIWNITEGIGYLVNSCMKYNCLSFNIVVNLVLLKVRELLINIKMWFNYIVENKVDMINFVNHKNELYLSHSAT